jgi:hypothetical protein
MTSNALLSNLGDRDCGHCSNIAILVRIRFTAGDIAEREAARYRMDLYVQRGGD